MKYTGPLSIMMVLLACTDQVPIGKLKEPVSGLYEQALKPFYHGVASGDPLQDGVIIWTRVTPEDSLPEISGRWIVSRDTDFADAEAEGTFSTGPERDYTVKVDVTGLEAGTSYFYRFTALDENSPVGKTRTASAESDRLTFAVVSCSNYEWGYFNAYGALGARDDLDAVIHLGDYIYEYAPGTYGDTTLNRKHLPAREILTLSDYRTRYSQYRLDADLRDAHINHPFINIWDDHEIANNAFSDGAQNHQAGEGSYETRKNVAIQAFYEWIPIREGVKHYRRFDYGNLAEIIMLDERLEGRTAPADSLDDPSLTDENRSMLGAAQLAWLENSLSRASSRWKIIGNQVIFSYLNWGYEPNFTINLDSWDGYPAEQSALANYIQDNNLKNIIFVTGDTHSSWAFEVTVDPFGSYNSKTGEGALAVEFGVPSINSANSNERFPDDSVRLHEDKITNSPVNPHLKYANLREHGFLLLSLTDEVARAEWIYVPTVSSASYETYTGNRLQVKSGIPRLLD